MESKCCHFRILYVDAKSSIITCGAFQCIELVSPIITVAQRRADQNGNPIPKESKLELWKFQVAFQFLRGTGWSPLPKAKLSLK